MPETNAIRQRRYRDSRQTAGENGERRLNTYVTTATALALRRLSCRYGVTKREMVQRLVAEADDMIIQTLDMDKSEWEEYFLSPGQRKSDGRESCSSCQTSIQFSPDLLPHDPEVT
jgi:hypothetical protein